MNAIEIKNLTKHYRDFTLDDLSLSLPEGCILGLIGENGAGKTTTLRLLLGMARPDGGTAAVLGAEGRAVREELGVVMDEPGLPACLSSGQVGKLLGGLYKSWDAAEYDKLLERLHIPRGKPYGEFSRGNRMKLGIAMALAHHPRLLLLDEPTSGLDPVVRDEVVALFSEFTRDEGHSILISSHIVSDLERLCDYVAFLHEGKLLLCEEKDALLEQYALYRCAPEALAAIDPGALLEKRETAYGVSALVRREALPVGADFSPVTLEELFVATVKEGRT